MPSCLLPVLSTSDDVVNTGEGEVMEVILNKGVTGLGFLIQGGRFTPKGDMPLTIKKVFKGKLFMRLQFLLNSLLILNELHIF